MKKIPATKRSNARGYTKDICPRKMYNKNIVSPINEDDKTNHAVILLKVFLQVSAIFCVVLAAIIFSKYIGII